MGYFCFIQPSWMNSAAKIRDFCETTKYLCVFFITFITFIKITFIPFGGKWI